MLDIIYYSNRSGNTKRFVEKVGMGRAFSVSELPIANNDYVLFVPTYGAGSDDYTVPRAVQTFLSIQTNASHLKAVVGFGNMNFGKSYCKAAKIISKKFDVPILGRVELFGTPEDVVEIQERLREFNDQLQLP